MMLINPHSPSSGHASRITSHTSRFTSLGQQFGYVHRSCSAALPAQSSGYVHEATNVARNYHVGATLFDALNLVLKYGARDVRILDLEQSAKPAAGVRAFKLDHLDPSH